jgi:hypothetical protein
MKPERDKVKCKVCNWKGVASELLHSVSPFDKDEVITGCPECKEIGSSVSVCDFIDCWKEATCGTPTEDDYRWTCGKHSRELIEVKR